MSDACCAAKSPSIHMLQLKDNRKTHTERAESGQIWSGKGSLLAGERHGVAHPLLRPQKVALAVPAATCHVTTVCSSSKDGHVALRPSITVHPMLWKHIVTDAYLASRKLVTFSVAGKRCTITRASGKYEVVVITKPSR